MIGVAADHGAAIKLTELIANRRIGKLQKIGEIVVEAQSRMHGEGFDHRAVARGFFRPATGQAETRRGAAIARVHRAPAAHLVGLRQLNRNLIG